MSVNTSLARALDEISRLMDLLGEDSFRSSAHSRAARLIEDHPEDFATLAADRQRLLALPGIGAKMADKITEFCTSGRIAELDDLRARVPKGLLALLDIPGLGPKTVRTFWQQAGITDIPSLHKAIADGSLATLPRMGEKSVQKIKDSLAFAQHSGQRLWLGKAAAVADIFVSRLSNLPNVVRIAPAGSLRRGKDTIGDIDILVALKDLTDARLKAAQHEVAEAFRSTPGVTQVLSAGDNKSSVRFALDHSQGRWKNEPDAEKGETAPNVGPAVQVDLRVLPLSSWGSGLSYFTGSKEHNVALRQRALSMGLTLTEWGLFPNDDNPIPPHQRNVKPLAGADEEGIYKALGLPYIPPEIRENRGELALTHTPRLVELADIRSDLHAHTTASDGRLSIDELAEEAQRRGMHTIAVTDHSKSSVIANGLTPDRLKDHIKAIRAAAKKHKHISILAGSEVDILNNGDLDYDDELLAQLDVVVASAHVALTQDPQSATRRLLRAIRHPLVHILGHPTGRLVNRRPGLSPDMEALFEAAKQHDVALEINAHWMRLDLRDTHVHAAVKAGCLLAINCDTHQREDLDNLRFGVATARRGWLPPEQCINTWPKDKLHAWLKKKRGA